MKMSAAEGRAARELTEAMETTMQQLHGRFQSLSEQLESKMNQMGTRIDSMEKKVSELMTQAGTEEEKPSSQWPIMVQSLVLPPMEIWLLGIHFARKSPVLTRDVWTSMSSEAVFQVLPHGHLLFFLYQSGQTSWRMPCRGLLYTGAIWSSLGIFIRDLKVGRDSAV